MLNNHLRAIGLTVALVTASATPMQSAWATTASGSATIDWSGLVLNFGAGPVSPFDVTSTVVQISATALSLFDFQTNFDITTPVEASTHVSFPGLFNFDLVSSASESSLSASFNLDSPLPGSAFNNTSSSAVTSRLTTITTLGAGTLTISVPYTLSSATNEAGVYSDAGASMTLLRKRGMGSAFSTSVFADAFADFAADANVVDSGLLTLVVPFLSGDRIEINFQTVATGFASVPAPVPVPPSALLLGGGLVALLVRRRTA